MKKEIIVMRACLYMVCLCFMVACVNQQTNIIDEEHKTFNVNGVSALDGYEVVSNSLKDLQLTRTGWQNVTLPMLAKVLLIMSITMQKD